MSMEDSYLLVREYFSVEMIDLKNKIEKIWKTKKK